MSDWDASSTLLRVWAGASKQAFDFFENKGSNQLKTDDIHASKRVRFWGIGWVFFCMERHQENKWALWEAYFCIFVSLFVASLPAATTFHPYGTPTSKLVHVNKPATVLLRNAALFGLHHLNCRATCLRCVFHKHARTRWWCAASCWTGAFVALRGLQIKGRFLPNKFYSRRTLAVNTCIRFMLTFQMA